MTPKPLPTGELRKLLAAAQLNELFEYEGTIATEVAGEFGPEPQLVATGLPETRALIVALVNHAESLLCAEERAQRAERERDELKARIAQNDKRDDALEFMFNAMGAADANLKSELESLRARVKEQERYMAHLPGCSALDVLPSNGRRNFPCSCGYREAMLAAEKKEDGKNG